MMGLEQDERVLKVVRRHWFLFAVDMALLFVVAIAPEILIALVPSDIKAAFPSGGHTGELAVFLNCLWLLLLWVALFVRWTDYYLDMWVITNKRVIDVDQKGLFNREITTASLNKIQDVTIDVRGMIPTLLGFGDLRLETAGENENIIIKSANNPQTVKEIILRAGDAAPLNVASKPS